jgi:GPH family glycoside/pentoside/hexuronide:cation symporter
MTNQITSQSGHEPLHWESTPHVTPPSGRLPVWRKIAYASGGLTDFFFLNVLLSLATQIYVTGMGMDIRLLGFALAIPKVLGVVTDPLFGMWSDNTHSRWGRRRPYILIGGIAGAVLLPLMWCIPAGSDFSQFAYLAVMISVFSVFYSMFSIPYGALGYELTTDYDERTRVFAWKGYLAACGALSAAWFYKFCTLSAFPNEVVGVRWLSVLVGLLMVAGAIATVTGCREHTLRQRQPAVPLGIALRMTFSNRPFLLLQGATQVLGLALAITGPMGWLVFLYYVCQANKDMAADITAYGGIIAFLTQIAANAMGVWIATRLGKREGGVVGFVLVLISIAILPWALTAQHPWWNVGAWIISGLGMPLISLMIGSMTADVCDEDELHTGLRREGAYSAVNGFIGKIMQIVIVLVGGFLPWLMGYQTSSTPPLDAILVKMKYLLIGIQFTGVIVALFAFWFYPITRARSEHTRRELDARRTNKETA